MNKFIDTEVRWGIIGVGNVCEVKSAPAMQKIPSSQLIAVMQRDAGKAADYAKRHGVPKWYSDAGELINDPDINAIYIATPPDSHLYYTKMAAAAGKPVYVEKPMAGTYKECLEMINVCENAGVSLFAAYYRRALPHFLKIKSLIEEGKVTLETDQDGKREFHFELPQHIQHCLIEKIVGELLGSDKSPSTGVTAARTNWVMEQIVYQH
jgi:predicted dehydrogenase